MKPIILFYIYIGASDDQLNYARLSVERYVMALIFIYAFYPNGDADMLRDECVFYAFSLPRVFRIIINNIIVDQYFLKIIEILCLCKKIYRLFNRMWYKKSYLYRFHGFS